jgi:hypothetical protein
MVLNLTVLSAVSFDERSTSKKVGKIRNPKGYAIRALVDGPRPFAQWTAQQEYIRRASLDDRIFC